MIKFIAKHLKRGLIQGYCEKLETMGYTQSEAKYIIQWQLDNNVKLTIENMTRADVLKTTGYYGNLTNR